MPAPRIIRAVNDDFINFERLKCLLGTNTAALTPARLGATVHYHYTAKHLELTYYEA